MKQVQSCQMLILLLLFYEVHTSRPKNEQMCKKTGCQIFFKNQHWARYALITK